MATTADGGWAPLRIGAYRTLWAAQLGSNVGTWMQVVAAQWMLVHQPGAATLTAAVQAASLTPVLFVSLPAGVLADVIDRKRLLVVLSLTMTVFATALTLLTVAGLTTPAVLLSLTFLMGCGQAIIAPTWQAIQPELVPRELIPAAAALGSLNINAARAVGPAIAGAIVAVAGPAIVFAVNAASFLAVMFAVLAWRRGPTDTDIGDRWAAALRTGMRYVTNAPGVRRILLRSALFVIPASALWALLAVTAESRLHLGPNGYGLLLGALGVGAIVGAVSIHRLRRLCSDNLLLGVGGAAFTIGTVGAAVLTEAITVTVLLVLAGIGWLVNLSTLNTALQLTLPGWVRARGMSMYLLVFLGGQGVASLGWGALAAPIGVPATLWVSAGALLLGVVSLLWWPLLRGTGTLDRTIVSTWPEPTLTLEPDPADGPVLVQIAYIVPPDAERAFVVAMRPVERSRRRTGARYWALYRDAAEPDRFVEVFQVPSWSEHIGQHHRRTTGYDAELLDTARAHAQGEPEVRHLLPAVVDRRR
ncbi:MFS transporter [Stackebrandtia soli]|uniref:MFS transporter n=1 Tax=Stackebrandtia soli TaxID=1892856 RepID=UPI0039ED098B